MEKLRRGSSLRTYVAIFFIAIFVFLFIGVTSYREIILLNKSNKELIHTKKIQLSTKQILIDVLDAETGQRGYLITKKDAFLKPYIQAKARLESNLHDLKKLVRGNDTQEKNFQRLEQFIVQRIDTLENRIYLAKINKVNTESEVFKNKLKNGEIIMDSVRAVIKNINAFENDKLNILNVENEKKVSSAPTLLLFLVVFSLIVVVFSFYKIINDLRKINVVLENNSLLSDAYKQAEVVSKLGTWQWDLGTGKLTFSDNHYRQLGYEPGEYEASDEKFFTFVHPEDVERIRAFGQRILSASEPEEQIYRIYKKDGSLIYLKTIHSLITVVNGKKLAVGVNQDITHEVKHIQELEKSNSALLKSNSELSAFNYIASHDLQEPLRKIQMFISRIDGDANNSFTSSSNEYFKKIQQSAERMRILINDLLTFSRLNNVEKKLETIDLNEVMERVLQDWATLIEEKNAAISIAKLCTIKGVPFLIQQLFSNLVSNALKYSQQGRNVEIKIQCEVIAAQEIQRFNPDKEKYHKITVSDNGIGFDNVFSEQIFVLFKRLHDKTTYTGTGIGLAICKKIVESHFGFIEAEGKPNVGATFTVYIPVI